VDTRRGAAPGGFVAGNVQRECVVPAGGAGLSFADRSVSWRPAEIAYFAQSSVIYTLAGAHAGGFAARGFTILDAKAEKLLQKYGLCIENLGRSAGAAAEDGVRFSAGDAVRAFRSR